MKPITVLVIDDSALIRSIFSEILSTDPQIQVIDTAVDPYDAREKIKRLNPDVITLDIEMPKMDGISFLEKIMALRPMPVIMVSTLTQKGAGETIRALELGAVDYVSKPLGNHNNDAIKLLKDELISKIKMAAHANLSQRNKIKNIEESSMVRSFKPHEDVSDKLIAIGSSTGGVEALRDLFLCLPGNCPPIVITQHMPEHFTKSFAARLDGLSEVNVTEAINGAVLKPGHAYLAPGGNQHMRVAKQGSNFVCRLENGDTVSGHRPSVDVLFRSVAQNFGENALGIILTGMGRDGAEGLLTMRKAGAYTIGQDQASCIVYGMPRAAALLKAVCIELPLDKIADHTLAYFEKRRKINAKN